MIIYIYNPHINYIIRIHINYFITSSLLKTKGHANYNNLIKHKIRILLKNRMINTPAATQKISHNF